MLTYFKKLALSGLLVVALGTSTTFPLNIYPFFDTLGSIADVLVARGELSEENTKMFNEVATKLGIDDRDIKARNSGLIIRLVGGYTNAVAIQLLNRVYLNDDSLNELSHEEKKFIMAHELSHHRQWHWPQKTALVLAIGYLSKQAERIAASKGLINYNNIYNVNLLTGQRQLISQEYGNNNFLIRYLTYGYSIKYFMGFSLWELIKAQGSQYHETEADTKAITIAGANPKAGVTWLNYMHYPTDETISNWPIYAQIQAYLNRIVLPIISLPLIKEHVSHPAHADRVAHIMSLQDQQAQETAQNNTTPA